MPNPATEHDFDSRIKNLLHHTHTAEAIAQLEQALAQDPSNSHHHYLLGNAFRQQNNWQKAIAHYNQATALNPDSPAQEAKSMLLKILNYRNTMLLDF